MPKTLISVDPKQVCCHGNKRRRFTIVGIRTCILPVAFVSENQVFRVECVDWTGGQIHNDDSSDDVKNVDLSQVHYLSGPIQVENAMPGDLLKVEILNLGCLEGSEWGFTGSFAKENGGGFLTDHFPKATKAIWDLEGVYCSSRHIPGVKFAGMIHPGLIGTAPCMELLEMWNKREAALCDELGTPEEKTLCGCLHTRPLACLPEAKGAMLGQLGHFKTKAGMDDTWDKVASEAARTVPGREVREREMAIYFVRQMSLCIGDGARYCTNLFHSFSLSFYSQNGGNCDIKNLSRGCTVYFPVFVDGANLSMGDMHISISIVMNPNWKHSPMESRYLKRMCVSRKKEMQFLMILVSIDARFVRQFCFLCALSTCSDNKV